MAIPPSQAHGTHLAGTSFHDGSFGLSQTLPEPSSEDDIQTIDFGVSPAYFRGLVSSSMQPCDARSGHAYSTSPYNLARDSSAMAPNAANSGLDPVNKLGLASNRASSRNQPDASRSFDVARPNQHHLNGGVSQQNLPARPAFAPQFPGRTPVSQPEASTFNLQRRNEDAAHITAELERRNNPREGEKALSTLAIQKQIGDDIAALRLEIDETALRKAEAERRNRLQEEEKANRRRLASQKQVEDGVKKIQLEKEQMRARVKADRDACRKWLSDLRPTQDTSSSAAANTSVNVFAALGCQLRGFWQDSRPHASIQAQRNEVISDVQRALTQRWPGQDLQVAAFGSSVTGLVTESSDLDLVLLDPTRPYGVGTPPELRIEPNDFVRQSGGMPEWYSTNQIANAIRASNKFRSVVSISGASVPIVKMVHRKYDIPADININERFGLFNSQLICAYADLQPDIVRPLIFFLKHWYSRRELNDPAGKRGSMTFSSYTIALMALQVLQMEGILPNLQSPALLKRLNIRPQFLYSRIKRPRRRNDGRLDATEQASPPKKYNVTFASTQFDVSPLRKKALELVRDDHPQISGTERLLGRMLVSFVRFYSHFDRYAQVVSILNGSPLQRRRGSHPRQVSLDSESEDDNPSEKEDHTGTSTRTLQNASRDAEGRAALRDGQADIWNDDELVVQDPFIIDRNTSRNIKGKAIESWQSEMQGAFHLLGLKNDGEAAKMHPEDVPLILDLCIPQNVLYGMEAGGLRARESASAGDNFLSKEPWREEEEAAAQARELAKQVAQKLRREKKKRYKRSKRQKAQLLQEEAAMVEDMIDGNETSWVTGLMKGNERHEIWRLRPDNDGGFGADSTPIPFTFSVARSPGPALSPNTPKEAHTTTNGDVMLSPTASTRTNTSSSSEDIDLVALRLDARC